ncbi:MAG: hypothetical protein ACYTAN_06935 [Planctomycetota bacterium]|jgi:hypothetical protein
MFDENSGEVKTTIEWMLEYLANGWGRRGTRPRDSDIVPGVGLYFVDILETYIEKRINKICMDKRRGAYERWRQIEEAVRAMQRRHGPMPRVLKEFIYGILAASTLRYDLEYKPKAITCPPRDHPMRGVWDSWIRPKAGQRPVQKKGASDDNTTI